MIHVQPSPWLTEETCDFNTPLFGIKAYSCGLKPGRQASDVRVSLGNNKALCPGLMASDKLGPSIGYGALIKLPVSILYDTGFGWRAPSRGWSFRGLEWAPSNSSACYAGPKPGSFEFTNARVAERGRIAQGRVHRISLPSCLPAGLAALETWEFTGKTCPRARESTPIHKRKITGGLCVGRPRGMKENGEVEAGTSLGNSIDAFYSMNTGVWGAWAREGCVEGATPTLSWGSRVHLGIETPLRNNGRSTIPPTVEIPPPLTSPYAL